MASAVILSTFGGIGCPLTEPSIGAVLEDPLASAAEGSLAAPVADPPESRFRQLH